MGLALFKERRLADRKRLTGLLPGRMIKAQTGQDLIVRPVDVSQTGMGIIVNFELEEGTEIHLKIQERIILLKVAWGQPDFGKSDKFRYGLITLQPNDNLEKEFIDAGCLV